MAHLSENPSECSVRPASNRTKFSVRFCGLRQCHVHFSIVIGPSTVTQCDVSRQTQASEGSGCRFAFRNPVVQASLVCSLTISSTSCQSAPRRRSSSSVLNMPRAQESGQHPGLGLCRQTEVWFFVLLVWRKKESKTEKKTKVEEIEKGDYGPPTRKVCC